MQNGLYKTHFNTKKLKQEIADGSFEFSIELNKPNSKDFETQKEDLQ